MGERTRDRLARELRAVAAHAAPGLPDSAAKTDQMRSTTCSICYGPSPRHTRPAKKPLHPCLARSAAPMADNPISTEAKLQCDCCAKLKMCRMYVLQDGFTAWVCAECRSGSSVSVKER